jgi:hypothetical protein
LLRDFIANTEIKEVVKKLAEAAAEVIGVAQVKLANLALDIYFVYYSLIHNV